MLSQPGGLPDLLRHLHELRVLEQFIPAMQHARYLMQFNDYHKYTVDEHCLRAVECAQRASWTIRGRWAATYRDLRNKRLLHLALLIHDLGKGYDDDHSEVGQRIAADTAQRLEPGEHETETLRLLVGRHLLMNHMAFREDMRDESVVLRLAREVGSPDVLQMLYLHSCADLAAVGPDVLNDWKLELLTELYYRTRRHLTGEDASQSTAREVADRRTAVQELARQETDQAWWSQQVASLPAGYLLTVSPQRRARRAGAAASTWPATTSRAWFHYSSGTQSVHLSGRRLRVRDARHLPQADRRADRQRTADSLGRDSHAGRRPGARPLLRGRRRLCGRTAGRSDAGSVRRAGRRTDRQRRQAAVVSTHCGEPAAVRRPPTSRNSPRASASTIPPPTGSRSSPSSPTTDAACCIPSPARCSNAGWSCTWRKIATYLDQVVDAFYVTNAKGQKIHSQEQLADIRQRLTAALEPPPTRERLIDSERPACSDPAHPGTGRRGRRRSIRPPPLTGRRPSRQ